MLASVAFVALAVCPATATANEDTNWEPFEAQHFVIYHRPDHRPQAAWYAEFIERVYDDISDLFGSELGRLVAVRLYPTESAYLAANPAAAGVNGILAHARPNSDEIGLALVRLEQLPAALRIDAFRHELTHLVLTERSAGRLPVGLHEGLAQYAERDRKGHQQLMDGLRKAFQQRAILRWADLDRAGSFYGRRCGSHSPGMPPALDGIAGRPQRHRRLRQGLRGWPPGHGLDRPRTEDGAD